MPEWLRSWTRYPLGSARRGSNPLAVVSFYSCYELGWKYLIDLARQITSIFFFHFSATIINFARLTKFKR